MNDINEALWMLMDMNKHPSNYIYQRAGTWDTTDQFDDACALIIEKYYELLHKH